MVFRHLFKGSLSFVISLGLQAQPQPPTAQHQVTEATVYLSGAAVSGKGSVRLDEGRQAFLIKNLPLGINLNTFNLSANADGILLSIKEHSKSMVQTAVPKNPELNLIDDSLKLLQNQRAEIEASERINAKQGKFLETNLKVAGTDKTIQASELKQSYDFFTARYQELEKEARKLALEKGKINTKTDSLNVRRIRLIKWLESDKSGVEVLPQTLTAEVVFNMKSSGKVEFTYEYFFSHAKWEPMFDLKFGIGQEMAKLNYKAKIIQTSGQTWKDVKLKLSTLVPNQNHKAPVFSVWPISYYDKQVVYPPRMYSKAKGVENAVAGMAFSPADAVSVQAAQTTANFTNKVNTELSVEYNINLPYTIGSSTTGDMVDIQNMELPMSFRRIALPRYDPTAYLQAQVSGWEKYELIPGLAHIYYEGSYVGESYLPMSGSTDTLAIDLTKDKNIIVTRQILGNETKGTKGDKIIEKGYAYQITVRNARKDPAGIKIIDNVPVANQEGLLVEIQELSGAIYDKDQGSLTWNLNLKGQESKKLKVKFLVKYPADKVLSE